MKQTTHEVANETLTDEYRFAKEKTMNGSRRVLAVVASCCVIALIVAASSQPATASIYSDAVLANNPHGYWRLGETSGTTAFDETSNNFDGAYVGGPALGAPPLITDANKAVNFDGSNDIVRIIDGALPAAQPTTYTLEAWVKFDTDPAGNQNIVWRTDSGETSAFSHILQVIGSNKFRHYTFDSSARFVDSTTVMEVGKTYHIVGVYSPSPDFMGIYVNGVLEGSYTGALNPAWNGGDRWLVGNTHNSSDFLDGTIDEVAVYYSALSAEDIATHYALGNRLPEPSTFVLAAMGLIGLGLVRRRRR